MASRQDPHWTLCGNNWLLIKRTNPNGNCLFEALLDQMNHMGLSIPNCWSQKDLRLIIVQHIIKLLPQYQDQIISNIIDTQSKVTPVNSSTILEYIKDLEKDHTWGGAETITAISTILDTRVVIFTADGHNFSIGPSNTKRSLKLLYSPQEGSQSNNHYESIRALHQNSLSPSRNTALTAKPHTTLYPDVTIIQAKGFELEFIKPLPSIPSSYNNRLKIGTWNIRGSSTPKKRLEIGTALLEENVILAGIQETHMSSGQYIDLNYTWHLSGREDSARNNRGVAILINKDVKLDSFTFSSYSENLASAKLTLNGIPLNFITCHIPCEGSSQSQDVITQLNIIIEELKVSGVPTIIAGDFNAHIGYEDLSTQESRYIGRMLKHKSSNNNGNLIKNTIMLHSLYLNTSRRTNKTTLTTWSNGSVESQLDHILSVNCSSKVTMFCNAIWKREVTTDHKLVIASLKCLPPKPTKQPHLKNRGWNIERLKDKTDKINYSDLILEKLSLRKISKQSQETQEITWEELKEIITEAASSTLTTPNSPMTPKRRLANANLQKAKFRNNKLPNHPNSKENLKLALKQRQISYNEHEGNKCKSFFNKITTFHPKIRTKLLYKFVKQHKKVNVNPKKKYIPISKWEESIHSDMSNTIPPLLEDPHITPIPPPTPNEIMHIIQNYKKGTAPGLDRINIELLQEGPPELRSTLALTLAKAWSTNIIPEDWSITIQVPIPKVPYPKSIDDYRRITLCNIAYKVYSKYLLNKLDESIPPIPQYQAAFLANRSTEDHIFTTRRIMEEAWREGRTLYLLALDLSKAFDTVDHRALISILKNQGVPTFLINRIITACLHEKSAIQWYGQTTNFYRKTKGVKQGCPISPRLFTLVLHEVISTTIEVLPNFSLGNSGHISLPTLLAYADDLIIIADNLEDLNECLKELEPNLLSTGLSLNHNKCEILIRDPYQSVHSNTPNPFISINNIPIKIVTSIKYLGSQMTEHLNRRGTIKPRIEKAIKVTRMLIPFLNKFSLPWSSIRSLYNMLIVPVATFGLKVTALTASNRSSLKNMEKLILSLLAQQCRYIPSLKITKLLKGKSIWRKIMCQRIRYWAHIQRRPSNNILQAAARIKALSKKVGRPCTTWHDSVENDFVRSGIPKPTWERLAKDRKELKKATSKLFEIENSSDEDEICKL